jgi:hypothetical protein
MLACENQECSRRFCEHCLLTHLGEDVDPMSSDAWTMNNGKVRPCTPFVVFLLPRLLHACDV